MQYKAISLRQPWASLIAIGAKVIETRSWKPSYRGRLLIHASAPMTPYQVDICNKPMFKKVLNAAGLTPETLPLGVIIAQCELVEVKVMSDLQFGDGAPEILPWVFALSKQELMFGEYGIGRVGLILDDVKPTKHVKCKGSLSLWTPSPKILAELGLS